MGNNRDIPATPNPFWDGDCNCTYTTTANTNVKMSTEALMELFEQLPERPKIFMMDIKIMTSDALPENWIMLSKSVAEALEEVMRRKAGI